ncbi:MAG: hypothetical protein ACPG9N_00010 [Miltoncostaeaceae bacterium]
MSDTTDTTTHDPMTEVVYAADVVVQFWPDGPPTAEILFRQEDPLVMWGDGSGDVDDATIKADAIAACNAALRDPMPLPLGGGDGDKPVARAMAVGLVLLEVWLEANVDDYDEDEETPMGPTLGELREMLEAVYAMQEDAR